LKQNFIILKCLKGISFILQYCFCMHIVYTLYMFLAHLAKGNVSFCHHMASVVCRPLHFEYRYLYLNKNYLSFNRGEYFFKNRPIRNKNCLWQPCLLMDRDEMSNLYRGASYQASEEKQFLFLIGWFFKNLLWNCLAKWTETW
jgi:hypothetical protein